MTLRGRWAGWIAWLNRGALLALVVIVFAAGREFVYDEGPYLLDGIAVLDRSGVSLDVLARFPQPAGISFGVLHWMLRPMTSLEPRWVRLVNPGLLLLVVLVLGRLLTRQKVEHPAHSAWTIMAVPFVWVLTGLALTEMVGIACATAGLWLLLESGGWRAADDDQGPPALGRAVLGGVLIGLAFYSRPPLVLFAGGVIAVADSPRARVHAAIAVAAMIVVILPAVIVWRGLVPPLVQHFDPWAFSVVNMSLSLGYAGGGMLLICPRWYRLGPPAVAVCAFSLGAAANLWLSILQIAPLRGWAYHVLSPDWQPLYGRVGGSLVAGLGLLFLVSSLVHIWRNRRDPAWSIAAIGMLLLVLSAGKITHQYSSRYTGVAAPLMVLAAARYQVVSPASLALLVLGLAAGAASLGSYLR